MVLGRAVFHPARETFALSEPQGLTGLMFAPLGAAFGSVVGYNLCLLLLLVLNALGARALLLRLARSELAATATGALALGLPFVWKELGVLQLIALWPAWFALSELSVLAVSPEPRAIVRLVPAPAALGLRPPRCFWPCYAARTAISCSEWLRPRRCAGATASSACGARGATAARATARGRELRAKRQEHPRRQRHGGRISSPPARRARCARAPFARQPHRQAQPRSRLLCARARRCWGLGRSSP